MDAGYRCHRVPGRRVPRMVAAEALIAGLRLDPVTGEQLGAVALHGVRRDFDPSLYERDLWGPMVDAETRYGCEAA